MLEYFTTYERDTETQITSCQDMMKTMNLPSSLISRQPSATSPFAVGLLGPRQASYSACGFIRPHDIVQYQPRPSSPQNVRILNQGDLGQILESGPECTE